MRLGLFIVMMGLYQLAIAQKDLVVPLSADTSLYLRTTLLNQVWVRWNQSNPGTLVNGKPADQTFDIGLRRVRIQSFGQIHPRVFLYFQYGMNNFNYLSQQAGNRKIQAFFHDAMAEISVLPEKDKLKIGGGLTIANGLSRFSQPSVTSIMSLDVPVFAQATVDQTDEFSRKLSLTVRGQLGKLDYRFALSDPFPIQTNGQEVPAVSSFAAFSPEGHTQQWQALLIWNLLDREPHTTPYMAGTYLGKRRVLNIEAGGIYQRDAMWRTDGQSVVHEPLRLWSVAGFMDMPLGSDEDCLNAYVGYFHTDYGQGYLRSNGIMNPANGMQDKHPGRISGAGNAYPMFGTGSVWYVQLGYLLPSTIDWLSGRWLPYFTMQNADYKRLDKPFTVMDLGISYLLARHKCKLSLDYQNRPVFSQPGNALPQELGRRNALVFQFQVFI